MRRLASLITGSVLLLGAGGARSEGATAAKVGKACTSVGAVGRDATGQKLVCTRINKKTVQWKLPALGSALRPVPLGQGLEAGPLGRRFVVRVTRVNLSAAAEVTAQSETAVPPAAGTEFVTADVEVVGTSPTPTATDHVWGARADGGARFASSEGCGGGFGTTFDVTAVAGKGVAIAGTHCFEVPTTAVPTLALVVEGWGDRADTYFALR